MSLSSVTVVLNALRLKKFRIERIKEDMNIEIKVESMMCQNCVRHVKEAVLQVEGVKGVEIDLKKKKVVVEAELELKEAVYNAIRGIGHEPVQYVKKGLFRK
jgi:Cu+-exporting ATPase